MDLLVAFLVLFAIVVVFIATGIGAYSVWSRLRFGVPLEELPFLDDVEPSENDDDPADQESFRLIDDNWHRQWL